MPSDRLSAQMIFLREIDKLKTILRQTTLLDSSRPENSAEHSWHLTLMALVLAEHSREPIDPLRVIRMLLIHDLVEIDAGDTFFYDLEGHEDKAERETKAAERIFGLLPVDQAAEIRELWDEFEARTTAESRFASALDRLQPLFHNYATGGGSWREHGITRRLVEERCCIIADGSPELWDFARELLAEAVRDGILEA